MNSFKLEGVAVRLVKDRPLYSSTPISCPEDACMLLGNDMKNLDREEVRVIYVNSKLEPIAYHQVSVGTLDRSIANPREMLKAAFLLNAFGMILAHNHPSGNVTPSEEDNIITKQINKVCSLCGISFLEHIIIGSDGDYYSYAEHQSKELVRMRPEELGFTRFEDDIDLPGLSLVAE